MTTLQPLALRHSPSHSPCNAVPTAPLHLPEQPPATLRVASEELGQGCDALDLLDMPPDVKDIYLRLVRRRSEPADAPVSKSELKILRIYTKKRLREAKKEAKRRAKERKRAARKEQKDPHGNGQRRSSDAGDGTHSFGCTTPVSCEEATTRPRYARRVASSQHTHSSTPNVSSKEVEYQESFFHGGVFGGQMEAVRAEREKRSQDEERRAQAELECELKTEQERLSALQQEENLRLALDNKEHAAQLEARTEGMHWKSRNFQKRTRGVLSGMNFKSFMRYAMLGLAAAVVVAMVVGIIVCILALLVL